jgi:hypothetical protein
MRVRLRVLFAFLFLTSTSFADDPRAEAESLFEEGRALVAKGRFEEACPKFAESYRLEPGVGTLLNLASCYERTGRTASAWARYREAIPIASRAGSPGKEKFARDHAVALEKRLSRLTVIVSADADVPDLVVQRDGQPMSRASFGTPIAVDPGDHVIEVRAPGKKTATFNLKVGADGDKQTITIGALADEGAPPSEKPTIVQSPPEPPPPPPAPRDESDRSSPSSITPQRVIGWAGIGTGSALVVGGVVLGVLASSKNDDAAANCPTQTTCNRDGLALTADARDFALGSTITITAGAVLAAAGVAVLLFWSSPRGTNASSR